MSAYLVFTRDKTLDEHELATYSKELLATLDGHEVKVLALHGSHEDLEGASTGSGANFIKCMFCRVSDFPEFRLPRPWPTFPERWLLFRLVV